MYSKFIYECFYIIFLFFIRDIYRGRNIIVSERNKLNRLRVNYWYNDIFIYI